MGSDRAAAAAPSGTASRKNPARARRSTAFTAPSSPRAWCRADRVDTATVSPTAVTDISME